MCILNYEIIVLRNSNNEFSNHFQTQRMFTNSRAIHVNQIYF